MIFAENGTDSARLVQMSILRHVQAARFEFATDVTKEQISVHALSATIDQLVSAYRQICENPRSISQREAVIGNLYSLGFEAHALYKRLLPKPDVATDSLSMTLCVIVSMFTTLSEAVESETTSLNIDVYPWVVAMQGWFVTATTDTAKSDFDEGLAELAFVYCEPSTKTHMREVGLKLLDALQNKQTAVVSRLASSHEEPCTQLALRYLELLQWETTTSYVTHRMSSRAHPYALDVEAAIESLVERADAELGAQVFRDLVLSFALPRGLVGLRHTLLLSRLAQERARREHGALIGHAHGAALQGPSRVWQYGVLQSSSLLQTTEEIIDAQHDKKKGPLQLEEAERRHAENEERHQQRLRNQDALERSKIERACVVLAGLGMLFASSASEARTGVAFSGRVRLPFLAIPAPNPQTAQSMLMLLSDCSWAYVRYEGGQPFLMHRGQGLDGLCKGAALLMHEHATVEQAR